MVSSPGPHQCADGATPSEESPTDADWYANLLWLDRRKCLLLVQAETLFSVFRADVRTAELRPFGAYVVRSVEDELREEVLPIDTFGPLQEEPVQVGKTASRRVLGFMNDMAVHIRYRTAVMGGLDRADPRILNRELRRTLQNRDGYIDAMGSIAKRLEAWRSDSP
ncbi:MAG: DUF6933 domain-containing protein [Steroidobacteraceae bacterium]